MRNHSNKNEFHCEDHISPSKMNLNCMKMDVQLNWFSNEWVRTKTRFDTEAKGNSEMAYWAFV